MSASAIVPRTRVCHGLATGVSSAWFGKPEFGEWIDSKSNAPCEPSSADCRRSRRPSPCYERSLLPGRHCQMRQSTKQPTTTARLGPLFRFLTIGTPPAECSGRILFGVKRATRIVGPMALGWLRCADHPVRWRGLPGVLWPAACRRAPAPLMAYPRRGDALGAGVAVVVMATVTR
jgi:hypothetical protein